MAYRRTPSPEPLPSPEVLTARMIGIGFDFVGEPEADADIESTLVVASLVGMEHEDLRVLSVLTTWLGVHHAHVNVDRLVHFVGVQTSARVRAYWAGVGGWLRKDRRFARLGKFHVGAPVPLLPSGNDFQLRRRGEDPRFVGTVLQVPAGVLRDRDRDVATPQELVRSHSGYRNRVLMGPSFRADVFTVLQQSPGLSIADVARRVACSFATAWQAVQDFRLLRAAER